MIFFSLCLFFVLSSNAFAASPGYNGFGFTAPNYPPSRSSVLITRAFEANNFYPFAGEHDVPMLDAMEGVDGIYSVSQLTSDIHNLSLDPNPNPYPNPITFRE